MATEEFYRDEHPKPGGGGSGGGSWGSGGGSGGSSGGGGSGGGSWGSGAGSGGDDSAGGGADGGAEKPWYLIGYWDDEGDQLIIVDANGTALTNGFELLLGSCCMKIEIECQIKGDSAYSHLDCIILGAVAKEGVVKGNSIFAGLLKNGEIDIYARWQKGHYNHASINTVRFRLKDRNETVTPWYKIPMGEAPGKRIMTLVLQDGFLTTKTMG